ncbi:hypothetical protein GCG21_01550 [Pseudactinotalea sp. HY160]|nr:hypothetical protein [Pseudactinotalea sp. HY160]
MRMGRGADGGRGDDAAAPGRLIHTERGRPAGTNAWGRLLARHPALADVLVVATFVASTLLSTALGPVESPLFWCGVALTGVLLAGRYRWPAPTGLARRFGAAAAPPALTLAGILTLTSVSAAVTGRTDGYEVALGFAVFALTRTSTAARADQALVAVNLLTSGAILAWGATPALADHPFEPDLRVLSSAAVLLSTLIAVAAATTRDQAETVAAFVEAHAHRRGPVRRLFHRRPRMLDLLVVLCFQVGAGSGTPLMPDGDRLWWLMAAVSIALFLRRGAPLVAFALTIVATLAATAMTGTTAGLELAVAIAIYAVTTTSAPVVAWSAVAAANVLAIAGLWAWGNPRLDEMVTTGADTGLEFDMRIGTGIGMAIVTFAAIAIGTTVRNRRDHLQRLLDRANQLALEREQLDQLAVVAERARIAREMHDVVAHSVQVMIALSDGARALVASQPDRAAHALDELSGVGRGALNDMRRVLGVLRQDGTVPDLEPQPQELDLEQLVGRFRAAGLPVAYTMAGASLPTDAALHLTLYRIVQEALTNVLRYAPHTSQISVTVRTAVGRDGVEVIVINAPDASVPRLARGEAALPGHAASSSIGAGLGAGRGLIGMRERVAAYGGTVSAGPHRGGWRVHATLDLGYEEEYADHGTAG